MKRLLLLFILSPVLLFGQMRQKAIVDSIKAAGNDIRRVSGAISSKPGNKVESVQVSDSGDYVNILVRVRVTEANDIPTLPVKSVARIQMEDIVTYSAGTVTAPPFPRLVFDADIVVMLPLHAAVKFDTKNVTVINVDAVTVPSLLYIKPEIDALPILPIKFKMEGIVVYKAEPKSMPELPHFELQEQEPIEPSDLVTLPILFRPKSRMKTVDVPTYEENRMLATEMHLSDEGYELLEKLEGFSPELYSLKDGGFTIGFGFFVPYGEGSKWRKGVTWEEAERLIRQKVPAYEDQVKQYINIPLTQEEFDALTMLAYNLGGFSKATSIVNDINTYADFDKLQKDWMRFVHSKAPGVMKGLMNRRKDELHVRYESNYQPERKIQVLKTSK